METENLTKVTDQNLLQMYANALKTSMSAGGHTKAKMNNDLAKEYAQELRQRNVSIPVQAKILEMGVFNGEGTF